MMEENGMYAIIETGGKQYKVSENDIIKVEKLNVEEEYQKKIANLKHQLSKSINTNKNLESLLIKTKSEYQKKLEVQKYQIQVLAKEIKEIKENYQLKKKCDEESKNN